MWPAIHTNKCHHTCSLPKNTISKFFSGELSMRPSIINVRTQKYLFTNPFLVNYLCGQLSIRTNVTIHIRTQKYLFTNPFSRELSMWPAIHTNKCHHTCSLSKNTICKLFSGELSMWPAIHTNKCHHKCSYHKIAIHKSFSRELSM
jgi:hypothetical protein